MIDTYEQHSKRKLIATILTIVVIAGAVVLADIFRSEETSTASTDATTSSQSTTPTTASTDTTTTTAATTTTSSGTYKDGTYTASSDYFVPGNTESIKVTLTISQDTITDVSIVNSEGDRESIAYQEDFTASYKSHVLGKKISGLQLSIISGASDTTQGFNDALDQIATKAQA